MPYVAVIVLFIKNSFEISVFNTYHGCAQKSLLPSL